MDPRERSPMLSTLTSPLCRSQQQTIAWAVSGLLARTRSTLPTLAVPLACAPPQEATK